MMYSYYILCRLITRQSGLTLVELMISIFLGLLVVMAATALLLSTKSAYMMQDDGARLLETGRYALENMARAVHQVAYENWDKEDAPIVVSSAFSASIAGLDASSLNSVGTAMAFPVAASVNGSDILAVGFFGSGTGNTGDGTVLNCAGFGVPAPVSQETAEDQRGWSIFYVAKDAGGEPELRCKYRSKSGAWASDAIARGVESFQVLYGIDTDGDGLANQFLNATAINAQDEALSLVGTTPDAKIKDKNKKTYWKKVVVVKVALLLHGFQKTRSGVLTEQYDMFGKDYGDSYGATDHGTRINEKDLPLATQNSLRKIFTLAIPLRNQSGRKT
jgi:type IV pilus assembly protein PilW